MTSWLSLAIARCAGAAMIMALFAAPVLGQAGASTGLSGRVSDASGAAVPGVTVTIIHVETGSQRVATTNPTGEWEARFLQPGTYRVTFELSGFRPLRRDGISVSTAEMAAVNAVLEIGGLAEAVTVTANADMI